MKKRVLCLALLVAVASVVWARVPMRQWVASMPDSVMPLLTKNNRLDFMDFIDSGMEAVVTNRLDGKSRMTMLEADFASIEYTKSSVVAMKLLPLTDTTDVLCMVTTMVGGVKDSRMVFYDEQWEKLDAQSFIDEPQLLDFCVAEATDSAMLMWKKVDVFFKTYVLSPDALILECELSSMDYLNRADKEAVVPYVRKAPLTYLWQGGRFVRKE